MSRSLKVLARRRHVGGNQGCRRMSVVINLCAAPIGSTGKGLGEVIIAGLQSFEHRIRRAAEGLPLSSRDRHIGRPAATTR